MERIGVRELRQHASRYLARVAAGEDFLVTDRGRPVAHLIPVPPDSWAEMLRTGRILAPTGSGDLTDESPEDFAVNASSRLAEQRRDER